MAKLVDNELLEALTNAREWVDAGHLAKMFRVTPKTVYNHVRRINEAKGDTLIESSARGYRLRDGDLSGTATPHDNKGSRADAILGRLLGPSTPVNMYDLADELHVADSTLQAELRRVRDEVSRLA